jgi:hypothetical protein
MGRRVLVAVLLLAVLLAAAVIFTPNGRLYMAELGTRVGESASGARPATLSDLRSIDDLKAAFNSAAGEPRLVLLLSPT